MSNEVHRKTDTLFPGNSMTVAVFLWTLYNTYRMVNSNQFLFIVDKLDPSLGVIRDDASWLKGSTLEIVVFPVDSWILPLCGF